MNFAKIFYINIGLLFCFNTFFLQAEETPNIILIYVDDLGYGDLSCQGSEDIRTPHIDELAASGIRFTAGYCTAPQCGPSRAGIMTGMNQMRFGYVNNVKNEGLPGGDSLLIMSGWMKRYGYTTAMIGKWHIGSDMSGDVEERSYPWNKGFDYTLMIKTGHSHYFPYRTDGMKWMTSRGIEYRLSEYREEASAPQLLDLDEDTYLTDVFTEKTVDFIKRHKEQPFFVYLAYNAPHTPCTGKPEDKIANSHITDTKRLNFAAVMTGLDNAVGNLMDSLDVLNLREETLVYFISDNGGPTTENSSKNDPFSGFKGDMRDGGIRIPYIVSWPGIIKAEQVLDEPVSTLDVLPTIVALAGGELYAPMQHEGVNILPYMIDGTIPDRDFILFRWQTNTAIRSGNIKLTEPFKPQFDYSGLYNIVDTTQEVPGTQIDDPQERLRLENILKDWNNVMEDAYKPIFVPPLSIRSSEVDNRISIYPMPVEDILTVQCDKIFDVISFYNMDGIIVFQQKFSNRIANIDVSFLKAGIYVLEVRCGGEILFREFVI